MCVGGGGPVTSFKVNFQGGDQHVLSGGGGGGGVHLFTKGVESIAKR